MFKNVIDYNIFYLINRNKNDNLPSIENSRLLNRRVKQKILWKLNKKGRENNLGNLCYITDKTNLSPLFRLPNSEKILLSCKLIKLYKSLRAFRRGSFHYNWIQAWRFQFFRYFCGVPFIQIPLWLQNKELNWIVKSKL